MTAKWPTGSQAPRVAIEFVENKEFMAQATATARKVMQDVAKAVKEQAKHNVSPGVGPGPHPHKPTSGHTDTGALEKSVFYRTGERGLLVWFVCGTDLNYGMFLEIGWHSKSGNFWKYPW